MDCASETHLKATRRVLRYIDGTTGFGIKFKKGSSWWVSLTMIWQGALMTWEAFQDIAFVLDLEFFHGIKRNKKQLFNLILKQNLLLQLLLSIKPCSLA